MTFVYLFFFLYPLTLSCCLSLHLIVFVFCFKRGSRLLYIPSWPRFPQLFFPEALTYCPFRGKNGTSLQYSCLENPMDGGVRWAAVHGVTKSRTLLSNFTFTFHFHALEKEMATHSSVLAWTTPGTGEPSGLPSVGSHRVGHD